VDHGSRVPEANAVLDEVARLLREQLPDRLVCTAHMELAAPSIAEAVDRCVAEGAQEIVVHPYFLGPGSHGAADVPRLVAEAARRHPGLRVRVTKPLGVHPALVLAVIDRVQETERREP
jgi:sirohydrochlorin ferrochelatase